MGFIFGILVDECAVGDSTAFAVLCVCGYKCGGLLSYIAMPGLICKGYLSGTWQSEPRLDFSPSNGSSDGVHSFYLTMAFRSGHYINGINSLKVRILRYLLHCIKLIILDKLKS